MKSKKILFLLDSLKPGTGGFASVYELMSTLSTLGHEVNVAFFRYDPHYFKRKNNLLEQEKPLKIIFHNIPGYNEILNAKFLDVSIGHRALSNIKNTIRSFSKKKVRILIESYVALFYKKRITNFENSLSKTDVIIKAITLSGAELASLRKMTKAKIIQNHAGSPQTYENFWLNKEQEPIPSDPRLSQYVNFCLGYDKLLFQSEDQATECASRHPLLLDRVLTLYPTCNETEVLKARKQVSPYSFDKDIIINVGTIQPRKAQHLSIEAFSNIAKDNPDAQLHFVGSWKEFNAYYLKLQKQVEERDLSDKVFFHGHKNDFLRYMVHATILVQSSEAEGVSRVLRESMFMQLPIVSFSIPGTTGILDNNIEALLVEFGDTKALGLSMDNMLNDISKKTSITQAAYKRYQRVHSNNVYIKCLSDMINQI